MDLLSLYNLAALFIFIISVVLIAGKLVSRFLRFRKFNMSVPLLLKRDLFLFGAIVIYVGTALIALAMGVQGLAQQPLWVIPRGTLLIGSFIYWAWVEYHIEDETDE